MKQWKWIAAASLAAVVGLAVRGGNTPGAGSAMAQGGLGGLVGVTASDCTVALIDVAVLASDRPGILELMEVTEGDDVRAGQKIAGLKDGIARAALKTATEKAKNDVQVRYAEKATEYADTELKIANNANMRLPGSVPNLEIEKLKLGSQRGGLQIEQAAFEQVVAKYTQEEAEEALKTYEVFAPFDGEVSKVLLKKGMAVRQGDPIVEVVSTKRFKVEGYVSVEDSYRVKRGDNVVLRIKGRDDKQPVKFLEGKQFVGKLKHVDARVEITSRVKVLAYVENKDELLKDGLRGVMTITPAEQSPVRAERESR